MEHRAVQMGDEKVTVHASFDPKTGKLSGGFSVEKDKASGKKKKVKVKQDAPKVRLATNQISRAIEAS